MNKVADCILKSNETGKVLFVTDVKAQATIDSRTSRAINVRAVMQEYPCAAAL